MWGVDRIEGGATTLSHSFSYWTFLRVRNSLQNLSMAQTVLIKKKKKRVKNKVLYQIGLVGKHWNVKLGWEKRSWKH